MNEKKRKEKKRKSEKNADIYLTLKWNFMNKRKRRIERRNMFAFIILKYIK